MTAHIRIAGPPKSAEPFDKFDLVALEIIATACLQSHSIETARKQIADELRTIYMQGELAGAREINKAYSAALAGWPRS